MHNRYKILVVNRDNEWLGIIKELQNEGPYQIEIMQNAAEAFEKIKECKYHIVLIDIDIPDYNGIQLLEEIKKFDSLTQIIVTTKQSTMDKILGSLENGASEYIAQPNINPEAIKRILDYSIERLERWRKSILDIVRE